MELGLSCHNPTGACMAAPFYWFQKETRLTQCHSLYVSDLCLMTLVEVVWMIQNLEEVVVSKGIMFYTISRGQRRGSFSSLVKGVPTVAWALPLQGTGKSIWESLCYKHSKWEEHQVELTLCEVPVNPATRDILRKSGFIALVTLEFCKIQLFSWFQRCHVLSQPLK